MATSKSVYQIWDELIARVSAQAALAGHDEESCRSTLWGVLWVLYMDVEDTALQQDAMDLLKAQLADGEITQQEFWIALNFKEIKWPRERRDVILAEIGLMLSDKIGVLGYSLPQG